MIMKGKATEKIPGGKLITVKVEYEDVIKHIQILGDFFIHPEESLQLIENSFLETPADEDREKIIERINNIVEENQIEFVGITSETITDVVKKAMGE